MMQHERWEDRKATVVFGNIGGDCPEPVRFSPIEDLTWVAFPTVEEGEFIITASMEYGYVKRPILKDRIYYAIVDKWDAFVADNQPNFLASTYPQWYYPMFGYWLPASSGTLFEFPNMWLFYRP